MKTPQEVWQQHSKLVIVTGEMGAGKTTWVRHFIDYARTQQATVCGLLSLALFEDGIKNGIGLVNLATGEQRQLARLRLASDGEQAGVTTKRWRFDPDTLAWGDSVLRAITETDLLVIDEIGPLELEQGAGWQSALMLLDADQCYRMACIVVRPGLLPSALSRWPHALVFYCPVS